MILDAILEYTQKELKLFIRSSTVKASTEPVISAQALVRFKRHDMWRLGGLIRLGSATEHL